MTVKVSVAETHPTHPHSPCPALILPQLSLHPRTQPIWTLLLTHRALLKCWDRTAGGRVEASSVDIRYMHGDIHSYPVLPVEVRHGEEKHSVKAVINSHLVHPLILCMML